MAFTSTVDLAHFLSARVSVSHQDPVMISTPQQCVQESSDTGSIPRSCLSSQITTLQTKNFLLEYIDEQFNSTADLVKRGGDLIENIGELTRKVCTIPAQGIDHRWSNILDSSLMDERFAESHTAELNECVVMFNGIFDLVRRQVPHLNPFVHVHTTISSTEPSVLQLTFRQFKCALTISITVDNIVCDIFTLTLNFLDHIHRVTIPFTSDLGTSVCHPHSPIKSYLAVLILQEPTLYETEMHKRINSICKSLLTK